MPCKVTFLNMTDYSIFYRRTINVERIKYEVPRFDIFVSAYNSCDRVRNVFSEMSAARKIWMIHPEYCYSPLEEPVGFSVVRPNGIGEVDQVNALVDELGDLTGVELCIDITGFMRHALTFLIAKLAHMGVKSFTALYSEPATYKKREETAFSTTTSGRVRSVSGMSGNNDAQAQDHLIIAVGYDHRLISEVANYKDDSLVYPVFAFPSLSADMYQQSAVKAAESGDVALRGEWVSNRRFAPANDPFSTAAVIGDLVGDIDKRGGAANIYLAPLSTKAQTLGLALYWQLEGRIRGGVTILLPECTKYSRETSSGLKRLWLYTVELT